jgi:hypothetical protein
VHQIYLVPGFLGFKELGDLGYFQGVHGILSKELREKHGIEASVIAVDTLATASLPRRARHLLEEVRARRTSGVEGIHFVGHSTGGLDVRLLLSERAVLEGESTDPDILGRTRTAVTLATPHFGTPLATHAVRLNLQLLVAELAFLATGPPLMHGLSDAAASIVKVAHLGERLGRMGTPLDWLAGVIGGFGEGGNELHEYLTEIYEDQGALLQLTPQSAHLFNASVTDRAGVRYSSFAAVAPPPKLFRSDPLFHVAHWVVSRHDDRYPLSTAEAALDEAGGSFEIAIDARSNDGIVPTLSQIHGPCGGIVLGDHLDVVGLFTRTARRRGGWQPAWLKSGAGFTEQRFRRLWHAIAREIASGPEAPPSPTEVIL